MGYTWHFLSLEKWFTFENFKLIMWHSKRNKHFDMQHLTNNFNKKKESKIMNMVLAIGNNPIS